MNWLRNRLRTWLGIEAMADLLTLRDSDVNAALSSHGDMIYEQERCLGEHSKIIHPLADEFIEYRRRVDSQATDIMGILKLRGELQAALQQVKEVREQILDPKRVPIRTTRSAQFRALMEQEP